MEFPKQGSLENGFFADILIYIHSQKMTGTVGLSNAEVKKVVSFSSGKPVASRSNIVRESLGGMLVARKIMTDAQLKAMVAELKEMDGIRIGQLLVSRGLITAVELEDLLKIQLLNRIYESLFWTSGDYKIVEGKLADTELVNLDKNIPQIICGAGIEYGSSSILRSWVAKGSVPVQAGGSDIKIEDLKLSGKELSIIRMINGVNAVDKIMGETKVPEQVAYGLIYALSRLGLVNIRAEKPKASASSPESKKESGPDSQTKESQVSESTRKFFEDIKAKAKQIEGKNYFQYFGLEKQAGSDQVKTAYFGLAKNFHPDRFPKDFTPEMKKEGEKLFSILSEGYNILLDSRRREEYLQKLELEEKGINQTPNQIMESEFEFQKGQILVKKGDLDGAIDLFKRAIAIYPEEAEYYISLGLTYFRKAAKSKNNALLSTARIEIEKGLSRNQNADKGYLYLGHMAKFENNIEKAKQFYAKALEVNPRNLEASSELRLINSREGKDKKGPNGGKGLFGR
jgi:curved DNA-binding protein CbpA